MHHHLEQFTSLLRQHLAAYLGASGATLYSAARTLRPGPVYLLGTNPGGSSDDKDTLRASVDALPGKTANSYLDEAWTRRARRPRSAASLKPAAAALERFPAGHGNWEWRGFRGHHGASDFYVAGLPHLSSYSPLGATGDVKPNVARWLRAAIQSDLAAAA